MNPLDASTPRELTVGLFIDADNVEAEVIEHAFAFIRQRGLRATVRRAYGGQDRLGVVREVCVANGVKLLPNLGKGTTDAYLIVDVMDLLHSTAFPGVVAIVSADADFAPLAIRLREAGRHTFCFANPEKADADALRRAYDEVMFIGARNERAAPAAAPVRRAAPARKSAAAPVPAPLPVAARAPTAAAAPDASRRVREILSTLPALRQGKAVELNEVVALLRREKLLGRTASGPRFLAKHAPYLRLTPDKQPNKVQWPGANN